ncbi:cupin domain-containing protein [Synechococcus sp. CBW1107]|uniref:cupin domain-containing protein n=1 Tax=Synechococcus sp. CBW1107 TaxID=2789857 RepID=UPI001E3588CC|nr:cupin domain-containing protein [Synechococcus sp. CBW1107]
MARSRSGHSPSLVLTRAAAAGLAGLGMVTAAAGLRADDVIGTPGDGGIITVRPSNSIVSRQRLGQFVGISGANSGAKGLSLNRVVIPPGGSAAAHRHLGSESAIYLVQGTVRTRYGERLEHAVVNRAGDFLFIPAGVPHQPTNLSSSEAAVAIVARNDPDEQEHVELIDAVTPAAPSAPSP